MVAVRVAVSFVNNIAGSCKFRFLVVKIEIFLHSRVQKLYQQKCSVVETRDSIADIATAPRKIHKLSNQMLTLGEDIRN